MTLGWSKSFMHAASLRNSSISLWEKLSSFMVFTATFCGVPSGRLRRPSITDPNSPAPWERSKHFTRSPKHLSGLCYVPEDLKCPLDRDLIPKRGRFVWQKEA